jgi:UDP-3-O-[3-hydroxymyristoyl] N-acetylglucosamine deacetylase
VYALGITNLVIEIHGEEVPMWDGSSQAWTHLLKPVVKPQPYKATTLRMLRTIRVGSSDAWCELSPCDSYELSYHLNFDHDLLHDQHVHVSLTPGSFEQDIHWARTFGFHKDLSHLRSQHKALGASLNNVCVFSDHGVLNPEGMRAPDEPCRHKILDAVGDLSLMGTRIQGHFTGHHSGHALNHELMRAVLSDPHAWEIV